MMPLRTLLRYIANNPHLIQKLSESPPIKEAAKVVAGVINKGRFKAEDKVQEIKEQVRTSAESTNSYEEKAGSFTETFLKEIKDGFKGIAEQMERDKQLEEERKQLEENLKKEDKKRR